MLLQKKDIYKLDTTAQTDRHTDKGFLEIPKSLFAGGIRTTITTLLFVLSMRCTIPVYTAKHAIVVIFSLYVSPHLPTINLKFVIHPCQIHVQFKIT